MIIKDKNMCQNMIDDNYLFFELENVLLKTIKQDIPAAMRLNTIKGGYFSSIRLIFCYIDVFGSVMSQ